MNILEANRLTKKYGDFKAVDAVDFSIAEGEVFGLLGPNGAGKTTTINMLTGLANITAEVSKKLNTLLALSRTKAICMRNWTGFIT
jgi:ABC-type multidrug transport system ATPase subunit